MDDSIVFYEQSDIAIERWGKGFSIDSPMVTMRVSSAEEVSAAVMALTGLDQVALNPDLVYYRSAQPDPALRKRLVVGFKGLEPDKVIVGADLKRPEVQRAYDRAKRAREEFLARPATD